MVSERGIAAETDPLLITVRNHPSGQYEVLVGVGSIACPAPDATGALVHSGQKVLEGMKKMFEGNYYR
jgi:hypothetical protein